MSKIQMKTNKIPEPISDTNGNLMVLAAFRYSLGRSSYIVGSCLEWVQQWWPYFENNTRNVIVRDTIDWLQNNTENDNIKKNCYYDNWKQFAEWGWNRMNIPDQKWCYDALYYKNKPWPLKSPYLYK
jgi:hypothetical protein